MKRATHNDADQHDTQEKKKELGISAEEYIYLRTVYKKGTEIIKDGFDPVQQ